MKFLIVFAFLIASVVNAQNGAQTLNKEVNVPFKPIENNTRIVFTSEDTNMKRRPTHVGSQGRKPIEDQRICYENELLYPGDNDGDWVCDCKPGYLHYPKNGICYEAYTQGPCQDFEIVVLTNASNIPLCIENRCEAGKVFFEDGCYPLNSEEGCLKFNKFIGRNVFLVPNPTTLELTCADEDFKYACVDNCCIGSKREYREVCRNRSKPKKSSGKV